MKLYAPPKAFLGMCLGMCLSMPSHMPGHAEAHAESCPGICLSIPRNTTLYVHIYIYIYIYIHTYMDVVKKMSMRMHSFGCLIIVYIHTYIYIYIYTYIHTRGYDFHASCLSDCKAVAHRRRSIRAYPLSPLALYLFSRRPSLSVPAKGLPKSSEMSSNG